jgi:hypothetical protein
MVKVPSVPLCVKNDTAGSDTVQRDTVKVVTFFGVVLLHEQEVERQNEKNQLDDDSWAVVCATCAA